MATQIKVRLVGSAEDDGAVLFGDFREFCASLSACLALTQNAVAPDSKRLQYKIVGLDFSSAALTLEPVCPPQGRDTRKKVVGAFEKTVAALQAGKKPDRRLGAEDIEAYRKLTAPLEHRTEQVWVSGVRVTRALSTNVDKILGASFPSEGFVTGRLERVNVHGRLEFVLYPPIGGYAVTCAFDESLLPAVRRAIKRNVTTGGRFLYRDDAAYPDRAVVSSLEIHPDDSELPTLSSLRGMSKGCTDGLTAVDFVRALRDA